jgi:hypothetical protein
MITKVKQSVFNWSDQGLFHSALDYGCSSAIADNRTAIIAALTTIGAGQVLFIPAGIEHTFDPEVDWPVVANQMIVEWKGNKFGVYFNDTNSVFALNSAVAFTSLLSDYLRAKNIVVVDSLAVPTLGGEWYINASSELELRSYAGTKLLTIQVSGGSIADIAAEGNITLAASKTLTAPNIISSGTATLATANIAAGTAVLSTLTVGSAPQRVGFETSAPVAAGTTTPAAGTRFYSTTHAALIASHTLALTNLADRESIEIFWQNAVTTLTVNAPGGCAFATGHAPTAATAGQSHHFYRNGTTIYRLR